MSRSLLGGREHQITHANVDIELRASLHDPGLGTDPGQFSVEFYVYMIPG